MGLLLFELATILGPRGKSPIDFSVTYFWALIDWLIVLWLGTPVKHCQLIVAIWSWSNIVGVSLSRHSCILVSSKFCYSVICWQGQWGGKFIPNPVGGTGTNLGTQKSFLNWLPECSSWYQRSLLSKRGGGMELPGGGCLALLASEHHLSLPVIDRKTGKAARSSALCGTEEWI